MELTWEGDLAFMTRRESGNSAFALQSLRQNASQEEIDEAFQSDVVEVWRDWRGHGRKFASNPRLSELTAIYEGILSGTAVTQPAPCRRWAGRSARVKAGRHSCQRLRRLHQLLQSLPLHQRRQTIMALPESRRRALEGWILSNSSDSRKNACTAIRRTRAAHIWRCESEGFVAAVHLGRGLHAQSAKCEDLATAARHFSALLRWRAKCQCLHLELCKPFASAGNPAEAELFARSVLEARPGRPKLFLRARMTISGHRLSTPLRADVSSVLVEWWQLGCHKGDSIFPASPEMAASRWLQTSNAWMDIWKKRGRAPESLQKTLSKAQKRFHCKLQSSLQRRSRDLRQLLQEERGCAGNAETARRHCPSHVS